MNIHFTFESSRFLEKTKKRLDAWAKVVHITFQSSLPSIMSRILLIFSAVFGLAASGLGFLNKQKADEKSLEAASLQQQMVENQTQLESKKKEAAAAVAKATEIEAKQDEMIKAIEAAKAEASQISSQLSTLKTLIADKDQQIANLKTEIELKASAATPTDATATPVADPQELQDLKTQKAELEQLNQSLTAKLEQTETRLTDLAAAEKARQTGLMRKSLEGRVLAINPAWNFAVISVGDRQGVVPNSEMIIRRGGEMIGKLKVTSVEPSQSIADIVLDTVSPGIQVQPGDTVIFPGT